MVAGTDHAMLPLHLLLFAMETGITTLTCIADMGSWTGYTTKQRNDLYGLYVPYIALGKPVLSLALSLLLSLVCFLHYWPRQKIIVLWVHVAGHTHGWVYRDTHVRTRLTSGMYTDDNPNFLAVLIGVDAFIRVRSQILNGGADADAGAGVEVEVGVYKGKGKKA